MTFNIEIEDLDRAYAMGCISAIQGLIDTRNADPDSGPFPDWLDQYLQEWNEELKAQGGQVTGWHFSSKSETFQRIKDAIQRNMPDPGMN